MAKKQFTQRDVEQATRLIQQVPPKVLIAVAVIAIIGVAAFFLLRQPATPQAAKPVPEGAILFCSWNVENFYDDVDDPKNDDKSEEFFARHPELFKEKVAHLADGLLMMNDGRGPDIMALCEVESELCMTALKDALNERLVKAGKQDAQYTHVLFKGDKLGRRFAPGVLTRLGVDGNRTRKVTDYAGNGRTIEVHIKGDSDDLIVMAAHWTSRVDSGNGKAQGEVNANDKRRMSYANDCYGRFKAIVKDNPDADVILCGDFNDEFKDPSIRDGLHATGDLQECRNAIDEPRPFALLASWPADGKPKGTIYGRGRWSIFDHMLVSRGMLDDKGWRVDPNTAQIFAPPAFLTSRGEPFRFGDERDTKRGYSDHLPVVVQLRAK